MALEVLPHTPSKAGEDGSLFDPDVKWHLSILVDVAGQEDNCDVLFGGDQREPFFENFLNEFVKTKYLKKRHI